MKKIFVGFIFAFFDFYINLGESIVHLLPNFIGYILIYYGLKGMKKYSNQFSEASIVSIIMSVTCFGSFLMDIVGLKLNDVALLIINIPFILMNLFILYKIVKGLEEMEKNNEKDLNSKILNKLFMVIVICDLISFIAILIPVIFLTAIIINVVCLIIFIANFYNSKKKFNEYNEWKEIKNE